MINVSCSVFQKILSFIMSAVSMVLMFFNFGYNQNICDGINFDSIRSISDAGYSDKAYKNLIGNDAVSTDFVCADEKFSVTAGGAEIPVYTMPLYSGQKDKGTLHSFCFIEISSEESFEIRIKSSLLIKPAIYPQKEFYQGLNYVSFAVEPDEEGTYTFFRNRSSDEDVLTIRIFHKRSEDEQIERYKEEYGSENVLVFDKGMHETEQIVLHSDSVLYLKSGAYLKVKHSDKNGGAIKAEDFKNIIIDGRGILDLSCLDWHERNGMEFLHGENLKISDITILNSANWSCYMYNIKNAEIRSASIFGSRQNGDGIDVCNSQNIFVENCFVRAGDDCYNVKTLGNEADTPSENISFRYNVAWATKARAAGITGETNCDIRNVEFDDMTVIRCDASWNDERIGTLAVVNETGGGNIENVSFKNIEIVDSECPPILLSVLSGRTDVKIQKIFFENINFSSRKNISICRKSESNEIDFSLKNVTKNGKPISDKDIFNDINSI